MSANPFRGGGGAITQSAPSFYASAPQTNAQAVKANNDAAAAAAEQDDDDIFASLEQAEKEFKKDIKRKAKVAVAGTAVGGASDGIVAAKKAKLASDLVSQSQQPVKAKPFLPPQLHNLQIPHSTQARMTAAAVSAQAASSAAKLAQPSAAAASSAAASNGLPTGVKAPPTATMTNEDSWKKAKSKKKIVRTG